MNIYDIDELQRKDKGLYDLIMLTFQFDPDDSIVFKKHTVTRSQEMRIDLICDFIYDNTSYCDILCSVNNIDNPLNVKEGEVILYPRNSDIKNLRYTENDNGQDISTVINSEKKTKQDPKRKEYNENKQSIPPTILAQQTEPVDVRGTKFKIGEGLF